jgi:hypothetical protein
MILPFLAFAGRFCVLKGAADCYLDRTDGCKSFLQDLVSGPIPTRFTNA